MQIDASKAAVKGLHDTISSKDQTILDLKDEIDNL